MTLTDTQKEIIAKASKKDLNGWHYLSVQGDPYEIGFQHGYLLTDEFRDAIRVYTHMTLELYGMDYSFFVQEAVKLHKNKISEEYLEEMQGMADGFTANGFETSLDDIIGWNDWMELTAIGGHKLQLTTQTIHLKVHADHTALVLLQLDLLRGMENLSLLTKVLTIFGVDNTSTFAKKFTQLMVMPLRCKPFLATSIQ